jgi:hypothetical protein
MAEGPRLSRPRVRQRVRRRRGRGAGVAVVAVRVRVDCPGRKPPFLAVKRPARPYKSAIQKRFK